MHIWTLITPLSDEIPEARQGGTLSLAQDKLWLFGGYSSNGFLNDLFSFDPDTLIWKSFPISSLPS
jgi:hypothetical protein